MRNLEQYVKECMAELDSIGIEYGKILEVSVNTRAKKRWGLCSPVCKNPKEKDYTIIGYNISISAVLLDENNSVEGLKNTIIHELLHTCKGGNGHTGEWKRLAAKVNRELGYNIKRTNSADEKGVIIDTRFENRKVYAVKCEECGYIYKRFKKSKLIQHPGQFKCGRCDGKLVRFNFK